MGSAPRRQRGGALDVAVWMLYVAALLGVAGAGFAASASGDGNLRFAVATICVMLSALCFAIGLWLDTQRGVSG